MQCPFCDHEESCVLESRDTEDGITTRRRRECLECNKRFTTYERVEGTQLGVLKKDGKKEGFDKQKVREGIKRAFEKRPMTEEKVEEIVEQVEKEMMRKQSGEVESRLIGNAILRRLKKIDKVAYVRFASVYLDFNDINDFSILVREIK